MHSVPMCLLDNGGSFLRPKVLQGEDYFVLFCRVLCRGELKLVKLNREDQMEVVAVRSLTKGGKFLVMVSNSWSLHHMDSIAPLSLNMQARGLESLPYHLTDSTPLYRCTTTTSQ
jgi:hypothetical protein